MMMSKYRSKKITDGGITFDSKKEHKRYQELRLLVMGKAIKNLELQKKYPLEVNGFKICSYVADFDYDLLDGTHITEDVKSKMTAKLPVFRLKAKLFKATQGYDITVYE
tara:strand:+ start:266 stop:592 length:327 start_codon:yes stop_codon:yes gene_type:complete